MNSALPHWENENNPNLAGGSWLDQEPSIPGEYATILCVPSSRVGCNSVYDYLDSHSSSDSDRKTVIAGALTAAQLCSRPGSHGPQRRFEHAIAMLRQTTGSATWFYFPAFKVKFFQYQRTCHIGRHSMGWLETHST